MTFTGTAKLAEIRSRVDHPIVDVDAHQLEVVPVLLEFLAEVGGGALADQWIGYMGNSRRTFKMTPEERLRTRTGMPVWWPVPTEITLDRATTQLPSLLYQRLDEIGLDFSVVYPGMGLLIMTLPGMADETLRRGSARAFNTYYAEMFRGLEDRMVPAAVIPMHTPDEAVEELEHAVNTLGHKVVVMAGDVLRPNPAFAAEHPDLADQVVYQDCFGIDSPYDYDPVWQKCLELGVAPTFHSGPIGWGCRQSVSRHQYNQLGGFAEGGEALAKSLFFGGVTYRFPELRFGFLEGGVAWGQALFCRMLEHWGKRNAEAIMKLDPSRLDGAYFGELIDQYAHPRVQAHRDRLVADSLWADHPEELDDWRDCGISRPEDVRDRFVPPFFYGCEGDDVLNANAFDEKTNPSGSRLNAMFGSDIGHFDVEDMREIVEEVYELVEDGLFSERDFRDFMCDNPIRLHGGMNPDFFKGTLIEQHAAKVLGA